MTESVLNPSPVPIRLSSPSAGVYAKLTELLREAGRQADDRAVGAASDTDAAEWRAVRDAMRKAATEALVPRGGTNAPSCRRCGIACPECSPEAEPPAAPEPPRPVHVEVSLDVAGYAPVRLAVQERLHYSAELFETAERGAMTPTGPRRLTATVAARVIA